MSETIQVARDGPVTTIVFDRPAARNALDRVMADEASAALAACNEDGNCGAVVLTGAGDKAFCAGMDLALTRGFDEAGVREWLVWLRAFYESIRGLDKPCVAAVNGVTAAAGYQIALLADLRIGHAGARMGQPEIDMGLASVLGAHLMEAHLGHSRTVALTLSGRLMDGRECHAHGLFHALVPEREVRAAAIAAARSLAAKPPAAMRLTKRRFREVTQPGFDAAFEAAMRLQPEAWRSGEPQRLMAAFLAKRGRE